MRRTVLVGVACLTSLLASFLVPTKAVSATVADPSLEGTPLGTLTPGTSVFHDGEYVLASRGGFPGAAAYFFAPPAEQAAADPCVTKSAYCKLYTVEVAAEGPATLRVALDSSKRGECFALELRDPLGNRVPAQPDGGFPVVCPEFVPSFQQYNIDTRVPDPQSGTWQIRVLGPEVEDWAFRVRAVLEGGPGVEPDLLAPNLVPWLPSEFGFTAPASSEPGTAIDRQNPPGRPDVSCHPAEEPEDSKCLRFSAGVYNVGDGPLNLRFRNDIAYQHVYTPDDTPGYYSDNEADSNYLEVEAGPATFHTSHKHRHFDDMVLYQLFSAPGTSMTPPYHQGNALTEVGSGKKEGYCTFSQGFENWFGFEQDHQFASFSAGNCDTSMTLERGWGDIYRWQRPSQFVPYNDVADPDGTMRAGFYVVRITIDPEDRLLETRENDNTGYAYIRVIDGILPYSDRVVVCEQGLGKSPWDPSKKVVEDRFLWAERLQDPNFQAETC